MGRNVTSYKSAAAVVSSYMDSKAEQNRAALNSGFELKSDVLDERKEVQDKLKKNEEAIRGQNKWRGIARGVGLVAGTVAGAIGGPLAGKIVGGAVSGFGQVAVNNTIRGPKDFDKSDYKFSDGIVDKQNNALRDYRNELGMKMAVSTISDALTAGNMGELLGGSKKLAAMGSAGKEAIGEKAIGKEAIGNAIGEKASRDAELAVDWGKDILRDSKMNQKLNSDLLNSQMTELENFLKPKTNSFTNMNRKNYFNFGIK